MRIHTMTNKTENNSNTKYTIHPVTKHLPRMDKETREALSADMRAHGMIDSIIVNKYNQLIDGVERYLLALKLNIKPKFLKPVMVTHYRSSLVKT